MKRIFSGIFLFTMLLSITAIPGFADADTNLLIGGTVTASSVKSSVAENAIDGNTTSTFWRTNSATTSTYTVELAEATPMDRFAVWYITSSTGGKAWRDYFIDAGGKIKVSAANDADFTQGVIELGEIPLNQDGFYFEARYEANDWEHGKGLVTANYDTAVLETAHLERDQVIIDGRRYRIGETDAAELLGMRVEYFAYEDEHGENRLLSVFATSKNHVLEFDSSRVEQMSADAIAYYETEDAQRTTKVRLSAPKLVINGQWINGFTDRDLTIDEGTVKRSASAEKYD